MRVFDEILLWKMAMQGNIVYTVYGMMGNCAAVC